MVVGLLLAGSIATAPTAEAAYRYWSYWRRAPGASGWTYSSGGPSYRVPDGAVEGWRFQPYGAANPSDPPPRSSASFDQICGGVAPAEGMKRVGITVDFGDGSSVGHYCVRISSSGTGDDALARRAQELGRPAPRYNSSGLLCAIDGKPPAPECGKQVESPKPTPSTARPAPSPSTVSPTATRPTAAPTQQGAPGATSAPSAPTSPATVTTAPAAPSTSAARSVAPSQSATSRPDGELVLETPSAEGDDGDDDGSGLPLPTVAGAGLVVALGIAASRRMRSRP